MAKPVLKTECLTKQYEIGLHGVYKHNRLSETMATIPRQVIDWLLPSEHTRQVRKSSSMIWALKDLDCEVEEGQVLGIIGKNGAGKSTLLKILSRITEPTSGRFGVRGRVASLLEVGTGFHPELTGRENVFVSGVTLGMTRKEVKARFEKIVDFSGVEKFIDTPVKRYSSGMKVRLGFAVAAHLDPEILIVDEVLAVGDLDFQRKCLTQMEGVASGGRTVLFVSHNMDAVSKLCTHAMLLSHGVCEHYSSSVNEVISKYLDDEGAMAAEWPGGFDGCANPWFLPTRFAVVNEENEVVVGPCRNDKTLQVLVEGQVAEFTSDLSIGFVLSDKSGNTLFCSASTDGSEATWPCATVGKCVFSTEIPRNLLNEGVYAISLVIKLPGRQNMWRSHDSAPRLEIEIFGGLSESPRWMNRRPGYFAPVLPWKSKRINS